MRKNPVHLVNPVQFLCASVAKKHYEIRQSHRTGGVYPKVARL